ncbi:chemotaxis protein CheW [Geoalkalibacter halelectricus]|uniref:Chemotaxis protein CheW n=1 Tax=Geoalkalibacter halelectricus TaxID=2847045 RepID=A0ABY5ZMU8_9BACT|nr:chemotaxis protein CheW [Geoalkalibacter halelectricus]MDO3380049.1 chemotaxis protein CheW [Geoalkalibacter halelectricus]UWZ80428.1 chemotaxis protein CheW [Geoalkalibacter halelectricus]
MIDLADIRKKARAEKDVAAQGESGDAAPDNCAAVRSSVQGVPNAQAESLAKPTQVAVPPPAAEAADALERLFSIENSLQLASEEIYFQGLSAALDQAEEKSLEWLTFSLGNEEYALDIGAVAEIIKPRDITEIPRVPEHVMGIISLRGVIVPIFDLKRRLRLGVATSTPTSRIIICQNEEATAGLLVDGISQVVRISERNIEPPPPMLADIDVDLVAGVGRHQGRFLILLNLEGLFNAGVTIRQ